MASPEQLAANRLNALRASGPKTEQGKRRSAINATRHGLTVPLSLSPWGGHMPELQALLQDDGFPAHQAQALAQCVLNYERNLQHQRNRYLASLGHATPSPNPVEAGCEERELADDFTAIMPARGSGLAGVSRSAMKSLIKHMTKVADQKQRSAEAELRNADRHLRHAANQLFKQCRSLGR